jgi:hypothetical protein
VYVLNALVANAAAAFPSGSAATLLIPGEVRRALLVPSAALVREGDLTAVWRVVQGHPSLTWVRVGDARDGMVEVLTGLTARDSLLVPGTGGDR